MWLLRLSIFSSNPTKTIINRRKRTWSGWIDEKGFKRLTRRFQKVQGVIDDKDFTTLWGIRDRADVRHKELAKLGRRCYRFRTLRHNFHLERDQPYEKTSQECKNAILSFWSLSFCITISSSFCLCLFCFFFVLFLCLFVFLPVCLDITVIKCQSVSHLKCRYRAARVAKRLKVFLQYRHCLN